MSEHIVDANKKVDEEIVAEQLAFVEWLKSHNAYNQWASADAMRMGHRVWKLAQQRVAELESALAGVKQQQEDSEHYWSQQNLADRDCNARLAAENAELRRLVDRHDRDYAELHQRVDRLRELLREIREFCYDSQLVALVPIIRKIDKAELAKGE